MGVQPRYSDTRTSEKCNVRKEIGSDFESITKKTALVLPLRTIYPATRPGEKHREVGYRIAGVANHSEEGDYHEVVFAVDETGRESATHIVGESPWEYREDPVDENAPGRIIKTRPSVSDLCLTIEEIIQEDGHEHPIVNERDVLIGFQIRARA